jgi:hypothetical protein
MACIYVSIAFAVLLDAFARPFHEHNMQSTHLQ